MPRNGPVYWGVLQVAINIGQPSIQQTLLGHQPSFIHWQTLASSSSFIVFQISSLELQCHALKLPKVLSQ